MLGPRYPEVGSVWFVRESLARPQPAASTEEERASTAVRVVYTRAIRHKDHEVQGFPPDRGREAEPFFVSAARSKRAVVWGIAWALLLVFAVFAESDGPE